MCHRVSSRCFDFCSARGIHYDCAKPKQEYSSWWFFTNPIEKYAQVKLDHFPIGRGENKRYLKPSQNLLFYYVNEAICIHVDFSLVGTFFFVIAVVINSCHAIHPGHGNLRGPPQGHVKPPRNKALIRPY